MFISRLTRITERYDPYGFHRLNGVKALYILFILFFVNSVFDVPNPYFYLFYAPMTSLNAEVLGQTIEEKYKLFIITLLGATFMIFFFAITKFFPAIFLYFSFVGPLLLYRYVLKNDTMSLITVPILLSLAAYSLRNGTNPGFHAAFENVITLLLTLIIMVGALILFPLRYYYRVWLRAFFLLIDECLRHFTALAAGEPPHQILIHEHTLSLVRFSQVLPRNLPIYSILKINILINRLHLTGFVGNREQTHLSDEARQSIPKQLHALRLAVEQEVPCRCTYSNHPTLIKLTQSWNYLCSKI